MGRGSSGGGDLGNSSGGVNPSNVSNIRDLVSERETKAAEVDGVLDVAKAIHDEYGVDVGQFKIADIGGSDSNTLAFTDGTDIVFNSRYFDGAAMDKAYDASVASGFHPSRGNKSSMEAVAAHEYGHMLTAQVGAKMTMTGKASLATSMDNVSKYIMDQARAKTRYKGTMSMAAKISGYAKHSNSECVAEAVADVYCNGSRASAESKAIVSVMNEILSSPGSGGKR